MGVEGTAIITCHVAAEGRLARCVVVSETPPGFGFGEAAIRGMSSLFKPRPAMRHGAAVDDYKFTVPMQFKLPEGARPGEPVKPSL